MLGRCKISLCSRGERAQATVEAALLLPVLLVSVALVLQPVVLLYTRTAMYLAATETARAAATAHAGASEEEYVAYAKRRLAVVPAVDIFHMGGESGWEVSVEGMGESQVVVEISGRARTLPLLGVEAAAFGEVSGNVVVLKAKVSEDTRAEWIGGSYESWISVWG